MVPVPRLGSDSLIEYRWVTNLADSFRRANMEVISDERLGSPDHLQPISSLTWVLGIEEYHYQQETGDELKALQKQVMDEAKAGAFVDMKYTLVVGRKPLEG
jgi:hypothetical protein